MPRDQVHGGGGGGANVGDLLNHYSPLARFLAEAIVWCGTGNCANVLRQQNKELKAAVDAEIMRYMVTFHDALKRWHISLVALALNSTDRLVNVPRLVDESDEEHHERETEEIARRKLLYDSATESDNEHTNIVKMRFGHNVALGLRKAMNFQIGCDVRNNMVYLPPSFTPETTPFHLGDGVTPFLSMCQTRGCELCARTNSVCSSDDLGGSFRFVPCHSGTLLMHCGEVCMEQACITLYPLSADPIGRPRAYGSPDLVSWEKASYNIALAKTMMRYHGVNSPMGKTEIVACSSQTRWNRVVARRIVPRVLDVHQTYGFQRGALKLLLLDTPSVPCGISFQFLIGASDETIENARQDIKISDAMDYSIRKFRKEKNRERASIQLSSVLQQFERQVLGTPAGLSIADINDLIPGTQPLVELMIVQPFLDEIDRSSQKGGPSYSREFHILDRAIARPILTAIYKCLGPLRRHDLSWTGKISSPSAYAYVRGLHYGSDVHLEQSLVSVHLAPIGKTITNTLGMWNDIVKMMLVFDAVQWQTIDFRFASDEEVQRISRDYNSGVRNPNEIILIWSFDVGGVTVSGPTICPLTHDWYFLKIRAAHALLDRHNLQVEFPEIPTCLRHSDLFKDVGNEASENRQAVLLWYRDTAKSLAAVPETRAMAFNILTPDRPDDMHRVIAEEVKVSLDVLVSATVAVE